MAPPKRVIYFRRALYDSALFISTGAAGTKRRTNRARQRQSGAGKRGELRRQSGIASFTANTSGKRRRETIKAKKRDSETSLLSSPFAAVLRSPKDGRQEARLLSLIADSLASRRAEEFVCPPPRDFVKERAEERRNCSPLRESLSLLLPPGEEILLPFRRRWRKSFERDYALSTQLERRVSSN